MPFCPHCGAEAASEQKFCGTCGQPLAQSAQAAPPLAVHRGRVLALLGALAAVVAVVLPWVTASSYLVGTVSATGLEGDGRITGALGLLLLFIVLVSKGQPGHRYSPLGAALGLGISLFALWRIVDIATALPDDLIAIAPGSGLYLTAAGGLLALVGSLQKTP